MTHYIAENQIGEQPGYDPAGRWAVLNCSVTQVLGRYDTGAHAQEAATRFGQSSFAYELTHAEWTALNTLDTTRGHHAQQQAAEHDTGAALAADTASDAPVVSAEGPGL